MIMALTFGEALAKAMAVDAQCGTDWRGDRVICAMLEHVSRPTPKPKPTRVVMAKSMAAQKGKTEMFKPKTVAAPKRRAWSRAEVESALNDGVARGLVSGTAAMAAMKAITPP